MSSCHNMQCDVQVAERRIKMDGAEISAINEENAEIKEVITKGVGVKVGDGTKTRLWEDKWVCEDSLMNRFPRLSIEQISKAIYGVSSKTKFHIRMWYMGWM